ncbi:MAG TPA: DUF5668 domain-containing protein [Candidatus Angelobacter sp.]|nr:DUF5668 domain-containing protein [Candidatus Angelobacter sp.]
MAIYIRNRSCPCYRCRARGLMGGAIMVTLGVLFLLENYTQYDFNQTWPVLLIVIGLLSFASRSASIEGHIQPGWLGGTPPVTAQGQNYPPTSGTGKTGSGPEVKS